MARKVTPAKPSTRSKAAKPHAKASGGGRAPAKPRSRRPLTRFARVRALLRPLARPALRWGLRLGVIGLLFVVALTGWLDFKVRGNFEGKRWSVPARVYARPLTLYTEQALDRTQLLAELQATGYRRVGKPVRAGQFSASATRVEIFSREFRYWDGAEPSRKVMVSLRDGRVHRISSGGEPVPLVRLEPALIARIYPTHREDRILKRLDELPPQLVAALILVEDRHFFDHFGISPRGIARAMLANVMAGGAVQGGSTLTQQLAKNFFLTPERTLWRKFREALISVILETRYDKETILAAYMNEIYLGQHGRTAVHGFGSAAELYFGRPVDELELHESALLVGLARGASHYSPYRHPERALERRNLVLKIMSERGALSATVAAAARAKPLGVRDKGMRASSPHPGFIELVRAQLRRDYQEDELRSEGLRIFTTMDPSIQIAAEEALRKRLYSLEKQRKLPPGKLQGAVVVVEPSRGQVLAVVGGRNPRDHGFNRALKARRPIGSLVKPAVYLTAFENHYSLDTPIPDEAVAVRLPNGDTWRPKNYDNKQYGEVLLRNALARSLNLATVHLGMKLGVPEVAKTLRNLGVARRINPVPSLLLGTIELTPLEVASLYQPLAAGGFQVPLRAIRDVTDADGKPLGRYALNVRQAADPVAVAELREGLMGVVSGGTARYAGKKLPAHLRVAGKTGTTDDLRDSWFAGFGADRLAVVWVGRDDNRPAKLTGASGALRVWTDLMLAAPPLSLPANQGALEALATAAHERSARAGGCEDDLLGGFIQKLLGSGCEPAGERVDDSNVGRDR
jgi:penicillin-binding protein 1B